MNKNLIEKYFALVGLTANVDSITRQVKEAIAGRADYARVPQALVAEVLAEVDASKSELLEEFGVVMGEFYTQDELEKIVGFLESPAGTKFLGNLDDVEDAQIRHASLWGERTALRAFNKLKITA